MRYGQGKRKSCSRYGMCDLKQETGPGRGIRAPPHRDVDRLLRPIGWAHRLAQQPRRPCWPQMARALEHRKARALLDQSTSTSARDPPPIREGGSSRATCPAALPPARPGSQVLRYSEHPWPPHLPPVHPPLPPRLPRPPYLARCNSGQATGDFRRAGCSCSCQSSVGGERPRRPGHSALSLTKTWPTAAFCRVEIPLYAYRLSDCLTPYTCNQVIQSLPQGTVALARLSCHHLSSLAGLGWAGPWPRLASCFSAGTFNGEVVATGKAGEKSAPSDCLAQLPRLLCHTVLHRAITESIIDTRVRKVLVCTFSRYVDCSAVNPAYAPYTDKHHIVLYAVVKGRETNSCAAPWSRWPAQPIGQLDTHAAQ